MNMPKKNQPNEDAILCEARRVLCPPPAPAHSPGLNVVSPGPDHRSPAAVAAAG